MRALLVIGFITLLLPGEWLTNFEEAKSIASHDQKFILLNFSGSDWCGPCIKMKKEVFENETFLSVASEKLVLVRADFPRQKKNRLPADQTSHNEALAENYNPQGKFPFTLLLDSEGKVIKEWDGYAFASQDKFISDLKTTLSSRP